MNVMKKKKFNPQQWLNTAQNTNKSTMSAGNFSPLGEMPAGQRGLPPLILAVTEEFQTCQRLKDLTAFPSPLQGI